MGYESVDRPCFIHTPRNLPCVECIDAKEKEADVRANRKQFEKTQKMARLEAEAEIQAEEDAKRKVTLRSMDEIVERNTDWLWTGRIPIGEITLIVGRGAVGKSTIMAWLAAKITHGTLDGYGGEPRAVLYVINEDCPERTVKPRMVAAGADMKLVYEVVLDGKGRIDMMRDGQQIFDLAKQVNAAAIMLDPLSSNVGTSNKNDQDAMRTAFENIQKMATAANIAVIGLGHTRKGSARDLLEALMGSSEQGNVCRSAMGVKEDETRPKTFIWSQEKMNLDEDPEHGFEYEIETYYYDNPVPGKPKIKTSRLVNVRRSDMNVSDMLKDESTGGKMGEARDWLMEYCMKHGSPLKSDVIADGAKAGHKKRSLEDAARRLCISTPTHPGGPAMWQLKS